MVNANKQKKSSTIIMFLFKEITINILNVNLRDEINVFIQEIMLCFRFSCCLPYDFNANL